MFTPPSKKPADDPFASIGLMVDKMMNKAPPKAPEPKLSMNQILAKQQAEAAAKKEKDELDAAKALLQPHFDVNDAHAGNGARLGNQVTQAEFDEHAKLLANITRGDTSLKFHQAGAVATPEEASHKKDTLSGLAKVMGTATGRKVIGDLSARNKTTTFRPTDNPNSLSNSASPDDLTTATNGTGSNATIKFRPGFDKTKALTGLPVDITSDTSLLHEMVHAHHMTEGSLIDPNNKLVEADLSPAHKDIGVKKEEYATVGLGAYGNNALTENAYRSEREAIHAADNVEKAKYAKRTSYNV